MEKDRKDVLNSGNRPLAREAVCTIVSKNYLAYARTFARSYVERNPGSEVFVLLVDRVDGYFEPEAEGFKLIELEDIGIEGLGELLFKYNVIELNTAVKPFLLDYLFKEFGFEKLIYFDPDILVFDDIKGLWDLLDTHSIILTPHLDAPLKDDFRPNDYDILLSGAYNLGFIAVKNTTNVGEFLQWWQSKLRNYCYVDHQRGYFVDQKWADLVPGMFEGVHILTDPGYNTAYWNLNSRTISQADGQYTVNGRPLRFFHFSGFSPYDIESISRLQNRFTLANREELRPLFEGYRDLVLKNGFEETRKWPYAFGSFDNGVPIPDIVRKTYGYMPEREAARLGDPFNASGKDSFFNWLSQKVGVVEEGKGIKRLWYEVYKMRSEAQAVYPDIFADDWAGFIQWCRSVGEAEKGIPEILLPSWPDLGASAEIIELRSIASGLEAKVRNLELVVQDKENAVNSLLNSLSWKITRPLRWLSGKLKRDRSQRSSAKSEVEG